MLNQELYFTSFTSFTFYLLDERTALSGTVVVTLQACLCIRNIAARGPDLRQTMLDEGCEAALRDAGKISRCVDEAYMALRDLRCEVTIIVALYISRLHLNYYRFPIAIAFMTHQHHLSHQTVYPSRHVTFIPRVRPSILSILPITIKPAKPTM